MPRGVPAKGYRVMTARSTNLNIPQYKPTTPPQPAVAEVIETDAEIDHRLKTRFSVLDDMVQDAINGDIRSLIASGPPGLGKTFTASRRLSAWDPDGLMHKVVHGTATPQGLFKMLWATAERGHVLVMDDCDSIFAEEKSLQFLKVTTDSTNKRIVSNLSEYNLLDDDGVPVPKTFEYNGAVIFITNLDFDKISNEGGRLAPHVSALLSRAHYIDLGMKTRRDYLIRINQVVNQGMLINRGLTAQQQGDVMEFVNEHKDRLRELSLRMIIKLGDLRKSNRPNWVDTAIVTCCRNR